MKIYHIELTGATDVNNDGVINMDDVLMGVVTLDDEDIIRATTQLEWNSYLGLSWFQFMEDLNTAAYTSTESAARVYFYRLDDEKD